MTDGGVRALAALVLVAIAPTIAAQDPDPAPKARTIILVRHAEKGTGDDPHLSDAGRERAAALVHALSDAEVSAVYATPRKRTRETASPLAEAHGLTVEEVALDDDYVADQARLLREGPAGGVAVVVSHSDTMPLILDALGVPSPPVIPDDAFDQLFVVTLSVDGPPTLLELRYGRPRS